MIVESCHSTWIFDAERMRFRRVLKDVTVGFRPVATGWRPYSQLQFDPLGETFTVLLTPDGSRRIRTRHHAYPCRDCGNPATSEFSLEEIRDCVSA